MTTMQEALAARFLQAAEIPTFLAETADLMNRSYANEKYGNAGLALTNGENASDSQSTTFRGGIPTKSQNRIRSGRAGRRAARGRQTLAAVGGLSYKGPWDAIKASTKPADYKLCRLKGDPNTGTKKRVAGTPKETPRTNTVPTTKATTRSPLLAAITAQLLEPKVQS